MGEGDSLVNVLVSLYCYDMHHDQKQLRGKGFIWSSLSDHNLLREVRRGTQART